MFHTDDMSLGLVGVEGGLYWKIGLLVTTDPPALPVQGPQWTSFTVAVTGFTADDLQLSSEPGSF